MLFPPERRTWGEIEVGTFVPGSGRIVEKTEPTAHGRIYVTFDREGDPIDEQWTAGHSASRFAPVALSRGTGALIGNLGKLEPELMYRFCDLLTNDERELRRWLDQEPA